MKSSRRAQFALVLGASILACSTNACGIGEEEQAGAASEQEIGVAPASRGPIGWETLRHPERLPYLSAGTSTRQYSGFARDGSNDNGFVGTNSCLRTGADGCVLAEDEGAGEVDTIWFTRIHGSEPGNVTDTGWIRVVLDGQTVIDARLQDVVDGRLGAPFVYPLVANAKQSSGGVYIKVPMTYRRSMRVSVQNNPLFYHVGFRHFMDARGVPTFDRSDRAEDVLAILRASGTRDPKPAAPNAVTTSSTLTLAAGEEKTAAQVHGPGSISTLRIQFPSTPTDAMLEGLRLQVAFDGRTLVESPAGEFFGTGLGAYSVRSLFFAADTNGTYTTYWPMPYREGATIRLVNRSNTTLSGVRVDVTSAEDAQWAAALAPGGNAGYFTAQSGIATTKHNQDWVVADLSGRGKMVGLTQTMRGNLTGGVTRMYLEGDERVYVDGAGTPQIYGTGTEDLYEAGWYFGYGEFSAPFNGNTAHEVRTRGCANECDATYRLFLGEAIHYETALRFSIEDGPQSEALSVYASTAYAYTQPTVGVRSTDTIEVGDAASRTSHAYTDSGEQLTLESVHEGDFDDRPFSSDIRWTTKPVSFRLAIAPGNDGVVLRRLADQGAAYQTAQVSVDGAAVGTWRQPLGNGKMRWLSDSFSLPASVTAGKSSITVTLTPDARQPAWTAARYVAESLVAPWKDTSAPSAPTVKAEGGRRSVRLSWVPSRDDSSIVTYRVHGGSTPDFAVDASTLLGTTPTVTFVHPSLTANQTRYYRVVAVDAGGNASAPSDVATATTKRPMVSDTNGDGMDDIVTFTRGAAGDVYVSQSDGGRFAQGGWRWHDFFAPNKEVPVVGDFDGDGKADMATFFRGTSGAVFVALSNGESFGAGQKWHDWFCIGNEVPLVGDFNGDGKDDIATFTRGGAGDVFVALSTGTGFGPGMKWHDNFALGTETPLVGDFDGDGRADIVTFTKGSLGDVYVALSNGRSFVDNGWLWHGFFAPGSETPGVGDFDGDGRSDIVTFMPGGAVFVALSNGTGFGPGQLWHGAFNVGSGVAGVGDFNGDGKADLIAYSRGAAGDVFVSLSDGAHFVQDGWRWQTGFSLGQEYPQPSLLQP